MKTNHLHAFTRTTDTLALVPIFLGSLAQGNGLLANQP